MSGTSDRDHSTEREPVGDGEPIDAQSESDGPLRIFSEQLGIDYDAVVAQAKKWVAEHPLPPDLGPEPFNVGKPRPPIDWEPAEGSDNPT